MKFHHFNLFTMRNTISFFFRLNHFAGQVTYDISKFAHKNNDILHRDVSIVMYSGSHPLMKPLFPEGTI